jgi:hypothetical protein
MLGGYAAHDHHANADQAKKACIRIPAPAVRNGACGLDGDLHSARSDSHQKRSAFAEEMQMPPVLF